PPNTTTTSNSVDTMTTSGRSERPGRPATDSGAGGWPGADTPGALAVPTPAASPSPLGGWADPVLGADSCGTALPPSRRAVGHGPRSQREQKTSSPPSSPQAGAPERSST